ncbi:hypothetical protein JOF41_004165 [Saccharothrix coeruleofusca]|uniref:hypothetical protein n=1 Tax=Saccharothrix coeruleofusca TaxID=33919 RepID=UPI001AE25A4E|nr:hypothetical protein [Saccharothrix coeruleofusca]MBP2337987.1 hypothetical protein [Saccharothrix coeruleofusca]
MGKRKGKVFIPSVYERYLRQSYGDLSSPQRRFALEMANRQPFEGIAHELAEVGPVADDTDINCDVCFTYIVHAERPLSVKLSMVGPYAVVLSSALDGQRGTVLVPARPPTGTPEARVMSVVAAHGFVIVPDEHLEARVPLAVGEGRDEVTLYAALFEPEGEVFWKAAATAPDLSGGSPTGSG